MVQRVLVSYGGPRRFHRDAPGAYREFWSLWKAGRYFECHEVLEELWRSESGRQRVFHNGLINCAVALYQHERGNSEGAARQLERARIKLESFRPAHDGVEIDTLISGVEIAVAASLAQLTDAQRDRLLALAEIVKKRIERDLNG